LFEITNKILRLLVGAGCSCHSEESSSLPEGREDGSSQQHAAGPFKEEFQQILSKLSLIQEEIYRMISENLMLFYKQVRILIKLSLN
jgi:hypothetical protein